MPWVLRFIFILCSRGTFPIRCVICFIFSCPSVLCAFMPWFLRFISSCAVGAGRPSGVSYALYFHLHNGCVLSYLGSHVLFYLVQSKRVPIRCVICFILSYPTVMYSLIPCNMFSDCSVHPLIWSVLSTIRTKCTITNCLKSVVMIRYAFTQSP